jgi:Protein of unknown function (DUF1592)/Protein of unknown function (DUF1588)/Protein of unknown function (DUF1587)/Protein of unknown function (DUF1585)/Protein of unknown function (DUF1595)/Planctomycete cytochrome C
MLDWKALREPFAGEAVRPHPNFRHLRSSLSMLYALLFTHSPCFFRHCSVSLLLLFTAFACHSASFRPFLDQHCAECHDAEMKKGGLDLGELSADLSKPDVMRVWVRIHDRVRDGEMPPPKKKQPAAAEKSPFLAALAGDLTKADLAQKGTVLRRLNRVEYENTLRDLLGIRSELAELLPEDGKAHGFDNVGEALDLSPVHLQRYMDAAARALDDAIRTLPQPEKSTQSFTFDLGRNAENLGKHWHKRPDGAVVFFNNGGFPQTQLDPFRARDEGTYRIRVTSYAYQSKEPVVYQVWHGQFGRNADSTLAGTFSAPPDRPTTVNIEAYLRRGETLRVLPQGLPNPYGEIKAKGPAGYSGPGLAVQKVEVEGPIYAEWPGRGHTLLFGNLPTHEVEPKNPADKKKKFYRPVYGIHSAQPEVDAGKLLQAALPVLFRRPVGSEKIVPYLQLARTQLAGGANFEQAMRTAYIAALSSPDFLFLREQPGQLDDFALAARLSYFLWSSGPDAELVSLAGKRQLSQPATLRAQTERLLKDTRAARFTKNFTGQWLNLREIDFTMPDKQLYPEYDDALKDAMMRETELFFDEVLKNNLSALDFVHSDWTMLNERLARHYRLPGVAGAEFRKVSLRPEHQRGGVLTHASVLKVSANGTTTSPVVRGIYVLERILGMHPAPPPPGVPGVEPDIRGATTLRQQLDKHRNLESCNGCHRVIDPPGFALENYDVTGGWRENYRSLGKEFPRATIEQANGVKNARWHVGPKVDAAGVTPDGKPFRSLAEYKQLLLATPEKFTHALAEKLATYASGRGMGFSDRAELDRITKTVAAKGNGFRDLIHEVVQSESFRTK